jgi:hypothetical protein
MPLRKFEGQFAVVPLPKVTHVFYGRNVGYQVERIELDGLTEAISATEARRPAREILGSGRYREHRQSMEVGHPVASGATTCARQRAVDDRPVTSTLRSVTRPVPRSSRGNQQVCASCSGKPEGILVLKNCSRS